MVNGHKTTARAAAAGNPRSELDSLMNVESEQAVIGGLLMDSDRVVDIRALLEPSDFFLTRHEMILQAIYDCFPRGGAVDIVTIAAELARRGQLEDIGGSAYLAACMRECFNTTALEDYARVVRDRAYRRRMFEATEQVRALMLDTGSGGTDDLQARVESLLREVYRRAQGEDDDLVSMAELMDAYYTDVELSASAPAGAITGMATGFTGFDRLLDGIQPNTLNLIAGRPGMGKTAWMDSLLLNRAAAGDAIYKWSGEMGRRQVRERLMSAESGIHNYRLRRGLRADGMSPDDWRRFVSSAGRLGMRNVFVDDRTLMTPSRLAATCHRLARRAGKLDLILVDYLGLMRPDGKYNTTNDAVGEISQQLKLLSKLAPVVCGVQLNRGLERRQDKRPVLSDLRDSGNLEQDADTVTFLYRDEVYNEATDFPNQAEFILAKNRHGPTGTVFAYFEKTTTRFRDGRVERIDLSEL